METQDIVKGIAVVSNEGISAGANTTDCAVVLAAICEQTADMMTDGEASGNDAGCVVADENVVRTSAGTLFPYDINWVPGRLQPGIVGGAPYFAFKVNGEWVPYPVPKATSWRGVTLSIIFDRVLRLNDEVSADEKSRHVLKLWHVLDAKGELRLNDFEYDSVDCGESWVIGGLDTAASSVCPQTDARRDPRWGWVPHDGPLLCGRVKVPMRDAMGNVWTTCYINDNFSSRHLNREVTEEEKMAMAYPTPAARCFSPPLRNPVELEVAEGKVFAGYHGYTYRHTRGEDATADEITTLREEVERQSLCIMSMSVAQVAKALKEVMKYAGEGFHYNGRGELSLLEERVPGYFVVSVDMRSTIMANGSGCVHARTLLERLRESPDVRVDSDAEDNPYTSAGEEIISGRPLLGGLLGCALERLGLATCDVERQREREEGWRLIASETRLPVIEETGETSTAQDTSGTMVVDVSTMHTSTTEDLVYIDMCEGFFLGEQQLVERRDDAEHRDDAKEEDEEEYEGSDVEVSGSDVSSDEEDDDNDVYYDLKTACRQVTKGWAHAILRTKKRISYKDDRTVETIDIRGSDDRHSGPQVEEEEEHDCSAPEKSDGAVDEEPGNEGDDNDSSRRQSQDTDENDDSDSKSASERTGEDQSAASERGGSPFPSRTLRREGERQTRNGSDTEERVGDRQIVQHVSAAGKVRASGGAVQGPKDEGATFAKKMKGKLLRSIAKAFAFSAANDATLYPTEDAFFAAVQATAKLAGETAEEGLRSHIAECGIRAVIGECNKMMTTIHGEITWQLKHWFWDEKGIPLVGSQQTDHHLPARNKMRTEMKENKTWRRSGDDPWGAPAFKTTLLKVFQMRKEGRNLGVTLQHLTFAEMVIQCEIEQTTKTTRAAEQIEKLVSIKQAIVSSLRSRDTVMSFSVTEKAAALFRSGTPSVHKPGPPITTITDDDYDIEFILPRSTAAGDGDRRTDSLCAAPLTTRDSLATFRHGKEDAGQ
ncbi:hypothetical protein CBR_g30264 [Chara braunii]|uniref:Uncharacterized protein n=1 Tax=Chara braunii TaxID=69332 RepID=A0A388LCS7_CHABU|nr:hypothetical protein CBR_g30264 [Chara braunii]|eukprot:GBG80003.1 hypothetical protein CBR_g30264 [Chara braunii]